ncbi:glycosyltransferase [Paeniglutamicibacter gangotriensis]|uniref:D-inositol 3-phosphate glycosyltransferase n=1 Tax=Paeniglutamicibacter gangotriensis TaxID=254787 RepID=A0A5B0DTF7_9MICC|nr:glycosyltransferase [Paeniglutamicibacter gangotriensis]KAA0970097.1 glycosyltransferase [Paeniglutamicibacter gangotriensis]
MSRAQRFMLKQRYAQHGENLEEALLADILRLESVLGTARIENSKIGVMNAELKQREVKLKGQLARQVRSIAEFEAKGKALRRELENLELRIEKEQARAEKFKNAYDKLCSHPIVRTARGLKSPFGRPAVGDAAKPEMSLPVVILPDEKAKGKVLAKASPAVKLPAPTPDAKTIELLAAAKVELLKFRDEGQITGPAKVLEKLGRSSRAPKSFGGMHLQLVGQRRLLDRLPSIPPKSTSSAYVPRPDTIMYCAHSTGEFNSNGYSTRTTGLTQAVAESGFDLFIAARPGYPWDSTVTRKMPASKRLIRPYQGVDTHFNPGVSLKTDPLDKFIQLSADIYVREAMMNRPSVIVAASNHITAMPALIAARRLGIPFVYEVRGLWEVTASASNTLWGGSERFQLARRLESLVASEADQVFAITDEVREELVLRGTAVERIAVLPNAANIFQYVPLPSERSSVRELKKPGEYLLGYAGSLVGYEGLDLLVDAISQLPPEMRHVGALIVGDGSASAGLIEQVKRLGLEERIRFTGRVPNDKINDYLAIFDAVVCPRKSNVVTELVSPLKPIEAMAAGRPVIGSNVSPIATLLGADAERGLLFAADDVNSLREKITFLANDPKAGQDIGRRAREWTVKNRTWSIVSETFTKQMRRLQQRSEPAGKSLRDIRMALIADGFTTSTLNREVAVVSPTPTNWRETLQKQPVDVLFVESAWAGNEGAWTRKVGYYDDEKCSELSELIEYCRSQGIPTIFWNKEDPVHFNRFKRTATLFDVVLTTDANCLRDYWNTRGPNLRSLGSMAFWAQPDIHNPMGSNRPYSHTVAYGGSFYGDRFADRSRELRTILEGAKAQGITIYDRQADIPDSPYKFPTVLQDFVQGGLAYDDMVEAYKSHPVHINVNSVSGSPTMFSRRVFEIAACGTPMISGKSFGVTWMFDASIPVVRTPEESEAISGLWMQSERDRVMDAWGPMRVVYQKHLAHHRLAAALRMAGISVEVPSLPSLGLELERVDAQTVESVLASGLRPCEVYVPTKSKTNAYLDRLERAGIRVLDSNEERQAVVVISRAQDFLGDPNLFEDMVTAYQYGHVASVEASDRDIDTRALPLWVRAKSTSEGPIAKETHPIEGRSGHLQLRRPYASTVREFDGDGTVEADQRSAAKRVLVVGHDLKFAGQIIDAIEHQGNVVSIDKWAGHAQHDVDKSRSLIAVADTIFCEWSLGNLVWYSKNLKPNQKLFARFHSQELFTEYPRKVNYDAVDRVIFVSELIRGMAIHKFGIPQEKTIVIPNSINARKLDLPKAEDSKYVLGYVGMVPQMKRFDLVLDLLEELRTADSRFTLRVKGKRPEDYPWMAAREEEMAFYDAQYARIQNSPLLHDAVIFDPQGDDMAAWYQQIGAAISTSDFESFHFTLADGAASRALPVGLAWPGSEWIYPEQWLFTDTKRAAQHVLTVLADPQNLRDTVEEAQTYAVQNYDSTNIVTRVLECIDLA